MPSSIVYGNLSGSVSSIELPSSSIQVLMGWVKRTTAGDSGLNTPVLGFTRSTTPYGELEGNWGFGIGTSSTNHFVRLQSTYWTATTQSISSSTDWYFVVLQRPTGSANINLRLFRDNGPTFTKDAELSIFSPNRPGRIVLYANDTPYQFTGIRYFTGSTFTDAQCREQATYRFPPTHPTASLYDYWIMETATQLTGSVNSTILTGSNLFGAAIAPTLSASSAPISIRPAQRLRYVNTNSTNGGNGTTNTTSSVARAYPSLNAAITTESLAANNTLLTTDQYLEIQCTGGPPDINASVVNVNLTTDDTRYVLISPVPGQEAQIPIDRNRYVYSGSLQLSSRYTILRQLQFDSSGSAGSANLAAGTAVVNSIRYFIGNTIYQRGAGDGLWSAPGSGSSAYILNNFISASSGARSGMLIQTTDGSNITQSVYNNTIVGGIRNYFTTFYGGNDTFNFKNNLGVSGSTSCYYRESTAVSESVENNASSDASGPANTVGGATFRNRPFKFRNVLNADYRLVGDDTGARRLGRNLSTDPYYPFSTDFFGQDRNRNGWWDIGADQADIGYVGLTTQPTGSLAIMTNTGSRGLVVGVQ